MKHNSAEQGICRHLSPNCLRIVYDVRQILAAGDGARFIRDLEEKIRNNAPNPGCLPRRAHAPLAALLAVFTALAAAEKKTMADVPERSQRQTSSPASALSRNRASSGPRCETKGEEKIVITCSYRSAPGQAGGGKNPSSIVITRAVISFRPDDSSNMLAKLTFTSSGTVRSSDARTVYLEIDDSAGNNYVRRSLPTVDFRKLSPGKAVTFSEELRVSAFPPGQYAIALWIPSSEPALKFSPARNLLVSSAGVPDPRTGLNILAKFTVEERR